MKYFAHVFFAVSVMASCAAGAAPAQADDSVQPPQNSSQSAAFTMRLVSAPSETIKNTAFAEPWALTLTREDGTPAADIPVSVSYPLLRNSETGLMERSIATEVSDSLGTVSFTLPPPQDACKDYIVFYDTEKRTAEITAPYLVCTDAAVRGGTVNLIDCDINGKPLSYTGASSSALLTALMLKGCRGIGIGDFATQIQKGDREEIYRAAKELLGSQSAFLIYGTVKYAGEPEKTDSGYSVTLTADVTFMDMKDGSAVIHAVFTETGKGISKEAALTDARRNGVAPAIADAFYYGF